MAENVLGVAIKGRQLPDDKMTVIYKRDEKAKEGFLGYLS